MPEINFEKYQGTGNDFIMIDNRNSTIDPSDIDLVKNLCHRKFGIGADGLILIDDHDKYDFNMIYYNPDGTQSLCGNGSRCVVMFARSLKIIGDETRFQTIDGPLTAYFRDELVQLKMPDVRGYSVHANDYFINTGSPHYVRFVASADVIDVVKKGKDIRYRAEFGKAGTNVNFVERKAHDHLYVRTYERGVEDETLSCGTGVTASAIASDIKSQKGSVIIETKGGELRVDFESDGKGGFKNIFLIGPAKKVYSGTFLTNNS